MAKNQEPRSDPYSGMRERLRKKYDDFSVPTTDELVPRALSTGIPQLDDALGIGGLPRGRIIDVYGEEAVGKTAIHMLIAKNILDRDPSAQICWLDLEHKLSTGLAKVIGLDLDRVLVLHPPNAENAFEMLLDLVADFDAYKKEKGKSKPPKPLDVFELIVFDSVAAAVSQVELTSDVGDVNIATIARYMSETLRKLVHPLFSTRTIVSFINQMRSSPMTRTYGNVPNEKPTGGKALKFYSSIRLDVKRSEYIKEGTKIVALKNKIVVTKNGVAEPFKEAEYVFNFKHGIDFIAMLVEEARMKQVITQHGSYFRFGEGTDEVRWLGVEAMMSAFRTDEALLVRLSSVLKR